MLARFTLLLIALPTLALAADGGGSGRITAAPRPTVQPAATAPTNATPRIEPPAPSLPPADPSECRMTCAQSYYFCRSGDHVDDCAGTWGECVAACNSPNLSQGFSTAP